MKTFKLAVLAAVAFVCTSQVQAQTTNLVQNLSIQLYGYSQGGASHFGSIVTTNVNVVRVDTRQIIQALGVATFNAFSSTSKLVVVEPVTGDARPRVQVRDGNRKPVDVSDFLVIQSLSDTVNGSVINTKNGRGTTIGYEVAGFSLRDGDESISLHFEVNGIATSNSSTPAFGPFSNTVDVNVSGSGDRNGTLMILQGSVDIFGHTVEVDLNGGVS
jgi:hypothetical protein